LPRLRDFETYDVAVAALTFAAIGFVYILQKKHAESAHDENPDLAQSAFAEPNERE
jgi:hypothetical protein